MKFNIGALQKDINNYCHTFASVFVDTAIKDLKKEADNCVAYFYSDYKPIAYDRTFDFLDNSVESHVIKGKRRTYTGWVDLLSNVDGGNYIYSNDSMSDIQIRMRSWLGIHGESSIAISEPSPLDYLMYFYYGRKFENNAITKAKTIANSQKFTCLKK